MGSSREAGSPGELPAPPEQAVAALYGELRELARSRLRRERPGSLRATELVHEAFLRIQKSHDGPWASRGQFFAAAAEAMRRILIDRARERAAVKRGGSEGAPPVRVTLEDDAAADLAVEDDPDRVLAIERALEGLAARDPRAAKVVVLKFYGGLSVEEVAEAMDISPRTVKRDWGFARAWLVGSLGGGAASD
jgi:RNA polymerase sigma factor (TIGR02999 family)